MASQTRGGDPRAPASVAGAWWRAIRPKTLSLSAVPVGLGTALALSQGYEAAPAAFGAALLCAVLIQIATNLLNDAQDAARGLDDPLRRTGPPRAVASGWLPAGSVRRAAAAALGVAFLLGAFLVLRGGWPILIIGLASLLAAVAYSSGPAPISHGPAGELMVLLFFGVAAVTGSHFLQSGHLDIGAACFGALIGLPAAGVLMLNNDRDREQDRAAGRRTLALIAGPSPSRWIYAVCLLLPLPLAASTQQVSALWMLPALPYAAALAWRFSGRSDAPALNRLLGATAGYQAALAALLCMAWFMPY